MLQKFKTIQNSIFILNIYSYFVKEIAIMMKFQILLKTSILTKLSITKT